MKALVLALVLGLGVLAAGYSVASKATQLVQGIKDQQVALLNK